MGSSIIDLLYKFSQVIICRVYFHIFSEEQATGSMLSKILNTKGSFPAYCLLVLADIALSIAIIYKVACEFMLLAAAI